MPNFSSSSVVPFDWPMAFHDCSTVKKRNLLENLQVLSETTSSTPMAPPFEQFVNLTNSKQRSSSNSLMINDLSPQLLHQTPSASIDRQNFNYAKIRARPLYNFQYDQSNIWTQPTSNSVQSLLNNVSFDLNVINKYFGKENKRKIDSLEFRSRSSSISTTSSTSSTGSYQILDRSSQIIYDVTMRHLIQLLNKDSERNRSIDEVLQRIDNGTIPNEWLQCVQRLTKSLTKQLSKHEDDRRKLENFPLDQIENLNLVEQFFVKLIRLENVEFKLKFYQFRDEIESQMNFLVESIDFVSQQIDSILNDTNLASLFQILCFLYNVVSDKTVPGLDLVSIEDALNSPTNQSNKTVAHVLAQILDDYFPKSFSKIFIESRLNDFQKFTSIKFQKLSEQIREFHRQFEQLQNEFVEIRKSRTTNELNDFIDNFLLQTEFDLEKLRRKQISIERNEEKLCRYFCSNDLSVDFCLTTIGRFFDKIHFAYRQNQRDKINKFKHL